MVKYLVIGKIINTHGIKGEIKVQPLTDDHKRYEYLEYLYIDINKQLEKYYIEEVKYVKKSVILKLKGVDTIEEAEKYKNNYLKIHRDNAIELPEGSFFICDIIGCDVYEEKMGKTLGKVVDVLVTGSNDVYIVKGEEFKEILIPVLKTVIKKISIEEKNIRVVLPEGLI
jgi:16S rRNA processing protein RimM